MAVSIPRGPRPDADPSLAEVVAALERFAADHPDSEITVYRLDEYIIRVRVVSRIFSKVKYERRVHIIWPYLEYLSVRLLNDIAGMLLLPPNEKKTSVHNREFDHPTLHLDEA